jgi:hypothetical protein
MKNDIYLECSSNSPHLWNEYKYDVCGKNIQWRHHLALNVVTGVDGSTTIFSHFRVFSGSKMIPLWRKTLKTLRGVIVIDICFSGIIPWTTSPTWTVYLSASFVVCSAAHHALPASQPSLHFCHQNVPTIWSQTIQDRDTPFNCQTERNGNTHNGN